MEKILKKRDVNIELLRFIAMLMITMLHCIDNGLIAKNMYELNTFNYILINFVRTCVAIANGVFILITGYYQIDKKINLKKIFNLWGRTIFYSLLIYLIFNLLNYKTYLFESIFSLSTGVYWFISAYIVLYFIAPILNILINKLNKNQLKYIVITMIVMLGILKIVLLNETFDGTLLPVIMYYIIGAYIKKYVEIKDNQKYFLKYILILIGTTALNIIMSIVSKIIPNPVVRNILTNISYNILDYSNILLVITTVLLFMKFKTIKINSTRISKFISILAPSVLSIYIIQQNVHFRALWRYDGNINYINSFLMVPRMFLEVLTVFTLCLIIDLIRRGVYYLFKKIPIITNSIDSINKLMDKLNLKINKFLE